MTILQLKNDKNVEYAGPSKCPGRRFFGFCCHTKANQLKFNVKKIPVFPY